MQESNPTLGGRIALLKPEALTPEQKTLYDHLVSQAVPWAESSGFKAKQADGTLLGPFNCILLSPTISTALIDLVQASEGKSTTLSDRVRQVVILTVGAVWSCDYERYAHSAVAKKAGLSDGDVQALCKGEPATSLTHEEQLSYDIVSSLLNTFKVPVPK